MEDFKIYDRELIDQMIDEWHNELEDCNISLQEYIGMTDDEWNMFVTTPSKLFGNHK